MYKFKRKTLLFLVVLLIINTCVFSQSTVSISEKFPSKILNDNLLYSIYLPANYSDKYAYPTLYLLHGFGGDETSWIKRSEIQGITDSLIAEGNIPPIIIIMPYGKNSYFINDYKNDFAFEDTFITEFIPFIDSNFSSSSERNNRAIGGLSMGGFGATILPIKNPLIFGTSINLSGAVRTPKQFISLSPIKYQSNFAHVFGDSLVSFQRITNHWKSNSPYNIIDSDYAKRLSTIHWYIDCGMQDFLYPSNLALHELFMRYKINHEYHMRPGNHSWSYWRESIIDALIYWGDILNK